MTNRTESGLTYSQCEANTECEAKTPTHAAYIDQYI